MRPKQLAVVLVLMALAIPAAPAHAGGIISVCDETHLLAALAGGGTVTFTCSGTIILTAEIVIAADTTIDGSGQTVTISGNQAVRVFTVNSGVTLNLNEVTVANGIAPNFGNGGGLYNNYGTVIVGNSTFSGNRAEDGGGIFGNGSALSVSNSTFSGNSAYSSGGGIYSDGGAVTVSNSTFSDNSAYGYAGGGMYNDGGAVIVSNSTFSDNSADSKAGGIYNDGGIFSDGTLTVSNSTFSGNSSFHRGGGIYRDGGTVTVSNSTFSGNSADYGGGIYNTGYAMLTVSNSTFSGNHASRYGGGIYTYGGAMTVSNSTFSDNSAYGYAGGGIYNSGGAATLTVRNTIVVNSQTGNNCYGPITDGGGNLSYPFSTCPGINADPMLGPLQNNGGPTETMALLPGSAAIDTGDDAICAAEPVNNLDQRGVTRPHGPHCDIGAVERQVFGLWFPFARAQ